MKKAVYSYRVVIAQQQESCGDFGSKEDWASIIKGILRGNLDLADLVSVIPIKNVRPKKATTL